MQKIYEIKGRFPYCHVKEVLKFAGILLGPDWGWRSKGWMGTGGSMGIGVHYQLGESYFQETGTFSTFHLSRYTTNLSWIREISGRKKSFRFFLVGRQMLSTWQMKVKVLHWAVGFMKNLGVNLLEKRVHRKQKIFIREHAEMVKTRRKTTIYTLYSISSFRCSSRIRWWTGFSSSSEACDNTPLTRREIQMKHGIMNKVQK